MLAGWRLLWLRSLLLRLVCHIWTSSLPLPSWLKKEQKENKQSLSTKTQLHTGNGECSQGTNPFCFFRAQYILIGALGLLVITSKDWRKQVLGVVWSREKLQHRSSPLNLSFFSSSVHYTGPFYMINLLPEL